MAIWALAGTLAFSFLLELIGASAANSSGWGIVGAIAHERRAALIAYSVSVEG